MKPSDPAYWMLQQGLKDPTKRTVSTVYNSACYICCDPEYALMGLPLCQPCPECGAHTAADDEVCDADHNIRELYERQRKQDESQKTG